jgi:formylglycine-generating enzyme required for sulfatase activity
MMSKYEITYGQWKEVLDWAESKGGYTFVSSQKGAPLFKNASSGTALTDDNKYLPVALQIAWRDVVVWCNALSEYTGREPVYYIDKDTDNTFDEDETLKASSNTTSNYISNLQPIDKVKMDKTKNGYRLPTEVEWEFAARGADPSSEPGSAWMNRFAGTDDPLEVTKYAYVLLNTASDPMGIQVGKRLPLVLPNGSKLYDMAGNAAEYCWDWVNQSALNKALDETLNSLPDGPAEPTSNLKTRIIRDITGNQYIFPNSSLYNPLTVILRRGVDSKTKGSSSTNAAGIRIVRKLNGNELGE